MKKFLFPFESFYNKSSWLVFGISSILFSLLIFSSCNKKDLSSPGNPNGGDSTLHEIKKKNIVLIIVDDMGYEIPTFSGGQSYNTPNMDFMASNGIWFSEAYSHPDGSPSRQALQTGQYNFRNYIRFGYMSQTQKCIGNLLQGAGYKTCFAGKWQFGDGDSGIKNHGYQDYRVYLPFENGDQRYRRYKSPLLYEKGAYMPDSVVEGKYSEDLFVEYIFNFLDSNKNNPFFITYCPVLLGRPFVPPPSVAAYKDWNIANDTLLDDNKYFAANVGYLDKKIGDVKKKLDSLGLMQNTIIIITSDNATSKGIVSKFNGADIFGGKEKTTTNGTNVPLIVYGPATVPPGQRTSTLVDFTDFLPTLSDIAEINSRLMFPLQDGTSFYDNITGDSTGINRNWVFCHWGSCNANDFQTRRFINNQTYKLYDTVGNNSNYTKFYNIFSDPNENYPIKEENMTTEEKAIKENFIEVLNTLH